MQYQWAEDDFKLPEGVFPLGLSAPVRGRNYVMYHGTTKVTAQLILENGFQQSEDGMLGRGVYLSRDLQKASRYPIDHPESDKVVIKVQVNVGEVIVINYQGHPRQKTWHDSSYDEVFDTAWVPSKCGMVKSRLEENCVWDPNRIKILQAINPRPVQPDGGVGARGYQPALTAQIQVNVGEVIDINRQGHPRQKTWHDSRYGPVFDTAWVPPNCGMVSSGLEEDCAWDPDRNKILKTINPRPVQFFGARGYQ